MYFLDFHLIVVLNMNMSIFSIIIFSLVDSCMYSYCYFVLGRYGDPLNPWGDIMTVAEAWCVTGDQATLAISVPTSVSVNVEYLPFNAHRIYGPDRYSLLVFSF